MINSLDDLMALRERVLNGEDVSAEELRAALEFARRTRAESTQKKTRRKSSPGDVKSLPVYSELS